MNDSFTVSGQQPANFKIEIPNGAKNARVVGGFKVTSGSNVNFYVLNEEQFRQWSDGNASTPALTKREQVGSSKIRQMLQSGTYYLIFSSPDGSSPRTVAAELYSKYD